MFKLRRYIVHYCTMIQSIRNAPIQPDRLVRPLVRCCLEQGEHGLGEEEGSDGVGLEAIPQFLWTRLVNAARLGQDAGVVE